MQSTRSKDQPIGQTNRIIDVLLWCAIIAYIFIMAQLLVLRWDLFLADRPMFRSVNLIPFSSISDFLLYSFSGTAIRNLAGNVVLFAPLGLLLQLMHPKPRLWRTALITCLISVAAEGLQYLLAVGSTDIDDVLLNTLGGLLGGIFCILLLRLLKDRRKARALIAIAGISCIVLIFATGRGIWLY